MSEIIQIFAWLQCHKQWEFMIDLYDEFKLGNKMREKLKNYTKFVKTTKIQQGCYFIKKSNY